MHTLRHLRPILALFYRERRGMMLGGAVLAATTVLAGIALLGLSGWFITATAIAGLSAATAFTFDVFAPAAGIRFLALARTGARYGERLVTHDATLAVLASLREKLFRAWAAPAAAHDLLMRPARLLFRLTADIDALDSLYLRVLVPAGAAFVTAIAAGLTFYFMSPFLGLAIAISLLLVGLGLPIIAAIIAQKPMRRRAKAVEALRARTIDLVAGQTELVLTGRLGAKAETIAYADNKLAEADDRLNRIDAGVAFGFGLGGALLLAGTLIAMAALAQKGMIGAPVAALGLLVAMAAMEPFAALRRGAMELGRTALAAQRLGPRLGADERANCPSPLPSPRKRGEGDINVAASPRCQVQGTKKEAQTLMSPSPRLRGEGKGEGHFGAHTAGRLAAATACHHGSGKPVLRDIFLDLRQGEKLALAGISGAGKSTLLGLLSGEIAPVTGIVEALPATLITQRTELFQDTVRANLMLANPAADDGALWAALEDAGLSETITALPHGLGTRLGEGGLGLSGGQSRRLALARLFLRDTPLWLLDEPTEGLDAATARDVLTRLERKAQGRALVIATHKRREAERADRIVMLEKGRVVAIAGRADPAFRHMISSLREE
ncbi:amino acid ABC transporter ATP-binding/permease protein [Phyllobacterium leguminum]|uniref:ATP-binding cassette subfamily C protein CydC n=1 Tax=Phyllobacterium leguminum TaxID=314237 RepID=A0A318T601_9HYPH|nr:amino acid ABC transporter ATP-binding/permease protein [Phyllobacterium leguminum]PYE90519.1 ATP-binding cassette subfamily C protein CydC [Phyllobacterium leguminum]